MNLTQRKTLIIGDVHACFEEFLALLKLANYKAKYHRLILVGDVINRGPWSLKMLQWLKNNQVEMVCGNHERAFVHAVKFQNFLSPALEQLKKDMKQDLNQWLNYLEALPVYIEESEFLVVHAGLIPGKHPKDSNPNILTNIRTWDGVGKQLNRTTDPAWYQLYQHKKLVIYGHWAAQGLNIRDNTIGLDSACVYGGKLSGIWLPSRQLVQVPALKVYYSKNFT